MNEPLPATRASAIQAVDVDGHFGDYRSDKGALLDGFLSGDAARVARRARLAGIEWTLVSPLRGILPRGGADAIAGNDEAAAVVPKNPSLRQWVVVNPLQPDSYAQAESLLKSPWCVGVAIEPDEHGYPIGEHGRSLFEFAACHRTVVITHSGGANSQPRDFVSLADSHPEMTLILSHLGHTDSGDPTQQVRAILSSRHGNIFTNTSSGKSIMSGLIEWAVGEVGAARILFGTDTPLYFAAMQRARIEQAEITDEDKRKILSENARKLFALPSGAANPQAAR